MACIRKRRGTWVVDYRDGAGIRHTPSFRTREEAENEFSRVVPAARQRVQLAVDPRLTLAGYAERWTELQAATAKPRTRATYEGALRRYIVPALGTVRVARLSRGQVKTFLARQLAAGRSRGYVKLIAAVLQSMLASAVDDGLLTSNPADRVGRVFKLSKSTVARQEAIKALDRDQLRRLLEAAEEVVPRLSALFLLLARAGLRLGEALALQWADLNFQTRAIRVARNLSAGRVETPKSGAARSVDMSGQLVRAFLRLQAARRVETLRRGWPEVPVWVFCTRTGTAFHPRVVQRAFARALRAANLPAHFTPHCLRHSFASLLLCDGVSPAYVQRMLGHASIRLTVDLYGKWLPMANTAAVDRLDDERPAPTGSRMVAVAGVALENVDFKKRFGGQPPKSFFRDSRKPPTSGP